MDTIAMILGIILMVLSVAVVVSTVLQSEKDKGLSGSITGSNSNDMFSQKSKARTREKVLSRITLFCSIALAIVAVVMYIYVSR